MGNEFLCRCSGPREALLVGDREAMSAYYRVVHFAPDPLSGWRVPIGALLSHADRPVFVQANWLPGPSCLGGEATSAVMRMIVAAIARAPNLQRLPVEAGPHAALSDVVPVPASVSDPARWLAEHILPGRAQAKLPERDYAARRDVVGRRFFEQYKVDKWLKRKLSPSDLGKTVPRLSASEITHYVWGKDALLLLEPMVATRSTFEKDLAEVSQLFLAWRQLLSAPAGQHSDAAHGLCLSGRAGGPGATADRRG